MSVDRRLVRWGLLLGVGLLVVASTGCARRVAVRTTTPYAGVTVYQAPPPAQVVVSRPAQPYGNAVWVDGHWQWNGNQYVWVDGYWVQQRPGYTFYQPRWVRQGNGYVYSQGGWGNNGRVVHYVSPGYVAPRPTVYVGPRRGYVAPRRTYVAPRGYVGPRGGSVVVRPQQQRRVYQSPPRRGGVVYRGGAARGATVTVRPR